jgi:prophage regulatory protein
MSDTATQSHELEGTPRRSRRSSVRQLPTDGYVRLESVLAVFPVSRSSWWKGIKDGRYPAAVKLGPRTTAWRVEDIRQLLDTISSAHEVA